jgi:hydrogenase maturation factor HypF (carbamoyltransferase family)
MNSKVIIAVVFISLVGSLPALADLGNVWTDFQGYTTDFRNYLTTNLADTLKPFDSQTQTAINGSSGALNLPNPHNTTKTVREQVVQYSISDKFENNSAVQGMNLSQEIDRQITRGAIEGVLGRNGQQRTREKLRNTETTLIDITKLATNAETNKQKKQVEIQATANSIVGGISGENLTGIGNFLNSMLNTQAKLTQLSFEGLADLELQNINIQKEQSKIIAETLGNTIEIHQHLQYSNLNLADISQQIHESNRTKRIETSAEVARLLRTTSQTDLYGRK